MTGWIRGTAAVSAFACVLAILPVSGNAQQCVAQFQQAAEQYHKNLGICAKRNRLMDTDPELVKLYQEVVEQKSAHDWTIEYYKQRGSADPTFTWKSKPNYRVTVPDATDGRWKYDGTTISFNCSAPLSVQGQEESFLECARVYSCALQASSCAVNEAHRTKATNCNSVANQCLQKHRIPGMASLDTAAPPPSQATMPQGTTKGSAPRTPPAQAPTPAQPDPRQQAFRQMSPKCQAQLNRLLEGADANDKSKATEAYASLRADCDAQIRRAAEAAHVGLPERVLSPRASEAMRKAMSGDPGQLAQAYGGRAYDGQFDAGEVINFGFALLGLLGGAAGFYAAIPTGAFYASGGGNFTTLNPRARSTYGQGGPTHVAPRANQSTITGTTR